MISKELQKEYKAPKTHVVELNVHGVLCGSILSGPGAVTIDGYTEETLDW